MDVCVVVQACGNGSQPIGMADVGPIRVASVTRPSRPQQLRPRPTPATRRHSSQQVTANLLRRACSHCLTSTHVCEQPSGHGAWPIAMAGISSRPITMGTARCQPIAVAKAGSQSDAMVPVRRHRTRLHAGSVTDQYRNMEWTSLMTYAYDCFRVPT